MTPGRIGPRRPPASRAVSTRRSRLIEVFAPMRVRSNLNRANRTLRAFAVLGPALVFCVFFSGLVRPERALAAPADEPAKKAPAEGGSAAAHEEEPNVLKAEPSLAGWTAVVFVLLLIVLTKFAWKPMFEAMRKREEDVEHILAETERARTESERLLAEHRKQMQEAAEQVKAFFEQGRRDAEATAQDILRKSHVEAEAIQARAKQEIDHARDQALMEIWRKTADLAATVAGRVLTREMSADDHRRLVETALNELPAAAADAGQGVHA